MGRKVKYSPEEKTKIVKYYLSGEKSIRELSNEYDVTVPVLRCWTHTFSNFGEAGLEPKQRNANYSKEFKDMVIQEYLSGADSLEGIALKFDIVNKSTLFKWIQAYNNHIELKDYDPKGDVYMAERRKTSLEERVEVVEYCLKHNREYKKAAEAYQVSYSQAYQWVKKYELEGQEGLVDRRGKRKLEESLSEVEKLQKKIDQLEKQLELKENENTLLKKVKEFERRRYSVKLDKKRNT